MVNKFDMSDDVGQLQAEIVRLRRWLHMPVEGRLAEHLASLARGMVVIRPPVGEKLAEAIGARRETVSHVLNKWQRQGLIEIRRSGDKGLGPARGMTLTRRLLDRFARAEADSGRAS